MNAAVIVNRRPILGELADCLEHSGIAARVLTCVTSVTDEDALARLRRYATVQLVDDYDGSDTEGIIEATCRSTGADKLISTTERDVLRCARVRGRLGISGQLEESATAFRDKQAMKRYARRAGIATARSARADDEAEVAALVSAVGFPLVVKPTRGVASKDTHVVDDGVGLKQVLLRDTDADRFIVEEFVRGDMWHVDGLMQGGEVLQCWPSRYLYPQWETMYHSRPNLSLMLPEISDTGRRLRSATKNLVSVMPAAPDMQPFHAEFFTSGTGEVVLCEIACRAGGAGIVEAYERSFGINLYGISVQQQIGRPLPVFDECPSVRHGWGWFPPRAGVLQAVPASCPLPGVVSYRPTAREGERFSGPQAVTDAVAELSFRADVGVVVEEQLSAFDSWWAREARFVLPPDAQKGL